jgi:Flp pilus assembly protein TadD
MHLGFQQRLLVTALVACVGPGCGWIARNDNAEGVRLYQQGNYKGAVDHFQQALARQPGSPDCFYNLGATYHQQAKLFGRPADLQTAEQYYHLCLARSPSHEACQRALAVLLVEQNRSGEAMASLQEWARRDPANPNPQIELARLCQEHGDARQAENHLIDALAVDPNNTRALVALGQLRGKRRSFAGAAKLFACACRRRASADGGGESRRTQRIGLHDGNRGPLTGMLEPPILPVLAVR